MLDLEVEVVQGLFASHSFCRIEVEHPRQEIDREGFFMGDQGRKRDLGFDWK